MVVPAPATAQALHKLKANTGAETTRTALTTTVAKPAPATKGFHKAGIRSKSNATPSLKRALSSAGAFKTATTRKAAPLAASVAFPDLKGMVTYSDDWTEDALTGLYSVGSNGSLEQLFLFESGYSGVPVEGLYYVPVYQDYGFFAWVEINAYDIATGEKVGSTMAGEIFNIAVDYTIDPTTGDVYGINYNENGDGMMLAKHNFSVEGTEAIDEVIPVGDLAGNWNSIACDAQGQLYAISYQVSGEEVVSSKLCKLDKTTAAVTEIGTTGEIPAYLSSSEIDTRTGVMYWTVCPPTDEGYLCTVDLATGAATKIADLDGNAEVQGLYIEAPQAEDGAPAAVTDLKAEFAEGSLSGTVSFNAPTTLFDGTAGSGALTYSILVNGEEAATGSTTFGAAVSEEITLAESGSYTFQVTVSNATGKSPVAKTTIFVGFGTPKAPTATLVYENGTMKLTWTAVTESTDGGYLDASAVTYTVNRFPGDVQVYSGTATSFSEEVAEPDGITKYYYTVTATANGISSLAATSNSVALGTGIVPPYTNTFDSADDLEGYTIIDANNDGKKWTFQNNSGNGMARISYNTSADMDDWLITPPVKLEGGKLYTISFEAQSGGSTWPERVEAKWGAAPTAAGMTNDLVEPTVIASTTLLPLGAMICPEADGTYYFGIHGISDANQYYLYVDNFSISAPAAATIPAAATAFTVTPDANGDFKASLQFTTPTVDMAGDPLPADCLTKVEVSRDDVVIKTFETPKNGETLSLQDTADKAGTYTYTVQAFNADGAGAKATVSAFLGVNRPAAPANVAMTEDGNTGKVTITWDAVTTDYDGAPINASKVTYTICESGYYGWEPISGYEGLTTTTVTFQAVPEGEQDFVQYGVFAVTDGGNTGSATALLPVGTPYDGLEEGFPEGSLTNAWGTGYAVSGGAWDLYTEDELGVPPSDGDGGCAGMKAQQLNAGAGLFTAKVQLPTEKPGVSFYTYNLINDAGDADINEIQLYVKAPADEEWTALGEPFVVNEVAGGAEGWAQATASLAAYAGQTVQVRFQATCLSYSYTLLDQIVIGTLAGHDLAATGITAPASVKAGADYKVDVTVANKGTEDATEFTVTLLANGEKAETKTVDALAAGTKTTISFELTMSAIATKAIEYSAEIIYTADEVTDNNFSDAVTVTPKQTNLPTVTDLSAEAGATGVALSWTEPDLAAAPSDAELVDFEDGEAFAMEYEGWTFVDVDESPVGGFEGTNLPGINAGTTTASFFVFDASGDQFNTTFAGHSGDMYLAALYRADDGTTDDWAISPELTGDAQTISFWACSYHSSYPEKIEMYYSTGSLDPADFTKVGNTVNPVPQDWTEYSFDVPAGAKHFAIRSCATGSFMLMLDDFTFAAAGATSADLSIVGYDVYRDGEKITAEPVAECEYLDSEAAVGEHSYVVVTVYTTGNSAPSNTATVTTTSGINDALAAGIKVAAGKGTITVTGAEGQHLTVAAADGKLYFNGTAAATETVAAPAGICIVKAGTTTVKVAVK